MSIWHLTPPKPYTVMMNKLELSIDGMTCAACVKRVETVLKKVPGVSDARVNLAARRATVDLLTSTADAFSEAHAQKKTQAKLPSNSALNALLIAAVKKAGYEGQVLEADAPIESTQKKSQTEVATLNKQVLIAALLTLPVFVMEMGGHLIPSFHHWLTSHLSLTIQHTIQAVLTTAVLAWPGQHFFTNGFKALFQRQPEMNSLVAVGAGSAWLYSMVVLLAPNAMPESAHFVYFEAAAVIVTLILLGRLLEARARGHTGVAIERLIGLQPKTARKITGESETDVPIETVNTGDILRVRPGEKIPVDGDILTGEPFIDQSMITGEPLPTQMKPGDSVAAGTINTTVSFTLTATHTGTDTVLARIIRMVQSAQDAKLPIQAAVDRVTAVFVPVVMVLAIMTFLTWYLLTQELNQALVSAVAVLIIACPCAMGLATPTSIMVGTGRAAQLGVLFRQGDALQQLQNIELIAFDKTGTLTQGQPTLTHHQNIRQEESDSNKALYTENDQLAIVAALQQQSEHPIARAILKAAQDKHLTLPAITEFEAVKGYGITAIVDWQGQARHVAVGSEALMQTQLQTPNVTINDTIDQWAQQGATPIHIAIDHTLVGLMAVTDPIKPEAKQVITALKQRGIECAMITGDHPITAQAVGQALGIDIVHAQVKPDQKAHIVQTLMQGSQPTESKNIPNKHKKVAFVGDGINDAPALATADVGIAIGTGTDVAIEAAAVVLMSGQLDKVVTALDVSKATLSNIHQNLFWAFAYNAALLPVAAGVLYPFTGLQLSPMLAAGAMALSSVFVVSNALRLRFVSSVVTKKAIHQ